MPAAKKAPTKKAPAKKRAPAKKKAAPKVELLKLEVLASSGRKTLSFASEESRDAAVAQLESHKGVDSKGLAHCLKDDDGGELRYTEVKEVLKL